jgi:hypothetical protein
MDSFTQTIAQPEVVIEIRGLACKGKKIFSDNDQQQIRALTVCRFLILFMNNHTFANKPMFFIYIQQDK